MRPRATLFVAAAVALAGSLGIVVSLWQAQSAIRRAEHRVLEAETIVAARLLRDHGGAARVSSMLGPRWRSVPIHVSAAGDVVIEPSASGVRATAAVLDADGWNVVGQVEVDEDPALRAMMPACVIVVTALTCSALSAVAWWCVTIARRRGIARSLTPPVVAWLVCAGLLAVVPVLMAERWAVEVLGDLTDRRLVMATGALAGRADVDVLAHVPSGILGLTGLRFVPRGTGHRDLFLASGLPMPVAQQVSEATTGATGRVRVDHVTYATADVGAVRLILLPFEHVERPSSAMLATTALGLLLAVPLLALASTLDHGRRARREVAAWSFLAPGLLHLAAFTVGPLVFAAWLSMHRWSLVDPARPFVGFDNYTALAGNAAFWNALLNTALFTLHVPFSIALALGLALLVRRPGRAAVLARAAFFLPSITSLVAVAMVWQWILNDEYGLANAVLGAIGLPGVRWLSSPSIALVSIMIVATWTTVGFQTVLFHAGLTAIPRELYDAARIDGASAWRQFVHVTLPGLRPTLVFVFITSVIGSFQVFGTVYVMTGGGPLHATDVAVFHIYEEAWELQRVGSAAAMSWTLFAVIFAVTWLHFRTLERRADA